MLVFLLGSCALPRADPRVPPVNTPVAVDLGPTYVEARSALLEDRGQIAAGPERLVKGRARLLDGVRDDLIPHWMGTPWDFYGTSTTPGEGTIACGYFVSTVLEHAGLKVERVFMAQQASEYIVKTFAREPQLRRFRGAPAGDVVDWVASQDDGLFIVGLDYHVGFLVKRNDAVEFCHSAYTGVTAVDCADPLTDPGFVSNYRVVGPVLTDEVVAAWLDAEELPTFRP